MPIRASSIYKPVAMQPINPMYIPPELVVQKTGEAIGGVITIVGKMVVGSIFHVDEKEHLKRRIDVMREELQKGGYPSAVLPQMNPESKERLADKEVSDLIKEGINRFEVASTKTPCTVCKDKLQKIKTSVEEETRFIIDASKKAEALRQLKAKGEVPEEKGWYDLTSEEKEKVMEMTV